MSAAAAVTPLDVIEKFLGPAEEPQPPAHARPIAGGDFDLDAFMTRNGLSIAHSKPTSGGVVHVLRVCAFDPAHDDGAAYIQRMASGALVYGCHHDSCSGRSWRELREMLEPFSQRNLLPLTSRKRNASLSELKPEGEPWSDPVALPSLSGDGCAMPIELIPTGFRPWLGDASERMRVPLEMLAVTAITAAGSLVGNAIATRPKRHDDWSVFTNFWAAVIAPPGGLKTPAFNEALKPLRRLDHAGRKRDTEEHAEREERRALLELEIVSLELRLKKSNLADTASISEDRERFAQCKRELADLRVPIRRRTVNDATTEKLVEILRDNPTGTLLESDELFGFLKRLDKQGREGDRQFYLEAWNGDGSFTSDRIGRGTVHAPKVCLSIVGNLQNAVLREYVRSVVANTGSNDGFLQRFQLAVFPDEFPAWKNVDRYPDVQAKNEAFEIFRALDELDYSSLDLEREDDDQRPILRFTPEAQELFDEWRDVLERRLRSPEEAQRPYFVAHLSKYRRLMPALAGIFYLIDCVGREPIKAISYDAAALAINWVDFLERHARKIYADGSTTPAERLLDRLRRGVIPDGETIRDISRHAWSGLSTADRVEEAVETLCKHGWARVETSSPSGTGRPTRLLRIHPSLRSEESDG